MELYRPVGYKELELIAESGYAAYPPRLSYQPIFYPVLNREYAQYIAKEWNTHDSVSGFAGFVTYFIVDDKYSAQFEIQTVGGRVHQELWIPVEELATFNQHISIIQIIDAFYGDQFKGVIDPITNLPVF